MKTERDTCLHRENMVLRLGVLVSLFAVATFILISGSLARHAGRASGENTTRVASFDYNVTDQRGNPLASLDAQSLSLFDTNVDMTLGGRRDRVIAPGAQGDFEIQVKNRSEVPIVPTLSITETNGGGIPIVYGYNGRYFTSQMGPGARVGDITIAGDMAQLNATLAADASVMDVGTPMRKIPITWHWMFDTGAVQANEKDTQLGLRGQDKVILKVQCLVEQVSA